MKTMWMWVRSPSQLLPQTADGGQNNGREFSLKFSAHRRIANFELVSDQNMDQERAAYNAQPTPPMPDRRVACRQDSTSGHNDCHVVAVSESP